MTAQVGMRIAWFSSGCSSFVAAYYGKPDRIVYIDVANQHPDSMRFLRDAEKVLGRDQFGDSDWCATCRRRGWCPRYITVQRSGRRWCQAYEYKNRMMNDE